MASAARRVLVVDDHQDTGETLFLLIQLWGHTVRYCDSGASALVEARAYCPDVVLLDLAMPAMSGYEVAQHLRETPMGRKATILAVSGFCRDEDRNLSAELGFDGHLAKPIDLGRLQAWIDSAPLLQEPRKSPAPLPGPLPATIPKTRESRDRSSRLPRLTLRQGMKAMPADPR